MDVQVVPGVAPATDGRQSNNVGSGTNVSQPERMLSTVGGGVLALYGLLRRDSVGIALAAVGASLLYRGVTGHCNLYGALGLSTADGSLHPAATPSRERAFTAQHTVTINRPRAELYAAWRNPTLIPRIMPQIESVDWSGGQRAHWVARAPVGMRVAWDAEITDDREDELIAWRSVEGADVPNQGVISFRELPDGRGTEVSLSIAYNPPGGILGDTIARLAGENPEQLLRDGLRRFKQLMETGEILATPAQSKAAD